MHLMQPTFDLPRGGRNKSAQGKALRREPQAPPWVQKVSPHRRPVRAEQPSRIVVTPFQGFPSLRLLESQALNLNLGRRFALPWAGLLQSLRDDRGVVR